MPLGTRGLEKMNEFIRKDTAIAIVRAYLIENQVTDADWHSDGIEKEIRDYAPADAIPLADVESDVDEAIRVLDAINSSGRMDYGGYCELHDTICEVGDLVLKQLPPMTPEVFKKEMEFIASRTREDGYDQEDRHRAAYELMMAVLEEHGYQNGCEVFEKMQKLYAKKGVGK